MSDEITTERYIASELIVEAGQVDSLDVKARREDLGPDSRDTVLLLFDGRDPGSGQTQLVLNGQPAKRAELLDWFSRTQKPIVEVDVHYQRYGAISEARFSC